MGDEDAELRQVAREDRGEKVLPPLEACGVVLREETLRQAPAQPEDSLGFPVPGRFEHIERPQFQRGEAAGQTPGLAEQRGRGGPDHQVASGSPPAPPPPVYGAAEFTEDLRRLVHLVEYDQPIPVEVEELLGLGDLRPVAGVFQVEIDGVPRRRDRQGERGLAGLAEADQSYGRLPRESRLDRRSEPTRNHPCKSYITM